VARGKGVALALCAGCHYDQKTGGLTGHHMVEAPDEFGELWSRNITGDPKDGIGSYTDGELAFLLRTGIERNGVYPGPFMAHPHASDEDILPFSVPTIPSCERSPSPTGPRNLASSSSCSITSPGSLRPFQRPLSRCPPRPTAWPTVTISL
jgi:hypothetical protein